MPTRGEEIALAWTSHAFLGAYTFLSPYHKKGMELCDVLVVFDGYVIVIQQKEIMLPDRQLSEVDWRRWKKRAVTAAKQQIAGAIRILRQPELQLFCDSGCQEKIHPARLKFNPDKILGVVIANGTQYSPKFFSPTNEPTLQLCYNEDDSKEENDGPFVVNCYLKGHKPLLILDDYSGHILFTEMNTAADFINYLEKRSSFLTQFREFGWNGEQELVAAYYMSIDSDGAHGFSFLEERGFTGIDMGYYDSEQYLGITKTQRYLQKKSLEESSFLIDHILTTIHMRHGDKILSDLETDRGMRLLASTSRFERRMLSERILKARNRLLEPRNSSEPLFRSVSVGWVGQHSQNATLFVVIFLEVLAEKEQSPEYYRDFLFGSAEAYALECRKQSDLGSRNLAYLVLIEICQGKTRVFDIVTDLGLADDFPIHQLSEKERKEGLLVGFKQAFQTAFFEEFPRNRGKPSQD